jgi:hypothetical protein
MNALRRHYGLPSIGHDLRRIYTDADLALFSDIPEHTESRKTAFPTGFSGATELVPQHPAA